MVRFLLATILVIFATPSWGLDASQGAGSLSEEVFNKLVEKCDHTDALVMRSRIRLQTGRNSEEVAATATARMVEGFEQCAAGDLDGAMGALQEALDIAEKGTDEFYGVDDAEVARAVEGRGELKAGAVKTQSPDDGDTGKPWWQFW